MADIRKYPEPPVATQSTIIEAYVAEVAKGAEHRREIAVGAWDKLTPLQQRELQIAGRRMSRDNLALSELYTQYLLLWARVSGQAMLGNDHQS